MTPEEYCYSKVARPGSALFYSIRKLKPLVADGIVAIYAFYKEIEDVTLNAVDAGVAQTKLNWWRDQVIKITQNKATHPVSQFLQKISSPLLLNPLTFITIIDGLEQNLTAPQFDKFEDVVVHVIRTAGTREFLIASLLQKHESVSSETIYQLALVMELVSYLQHCRSYAKRGLIFFSQEEMTQCNVSETDLTQSKTTEAVRKLFALQAEKIERAYQKALTALSPEQKKELSNMLVRANISRGILHAMQGKKYRVLESHIDIAPLRYWWIAWRVAANF
jgi:phytoene synthase